MTVFALYSYSIYSNEDMSHSTILPHLIFKILLYLMPLKKDHMHSHACLFMERHSCHMITVMILLSVEIYDEANVLY